MHGPNDPTLHYAPHYNLPVPVVDSVAFALRPFKRRIWRRQRDGALELWAASGITFSVSEDPEPGTWDGDLSDQYIPKTIHMLRGQKNTSGAYMPTDYASWNGSSDSAVTVLTPLPKWWQDYKFRDVRGLICHELGHCLGLAHRSDGGVMAGAWKPDDHDLDSVRKWYLGGVFG